MSKAILIVELYSNCIECPLCYHDDYFENRDSVDTYKCAPRSIHLSEEDAIKRNDHCPLVAQGESC